MLVDLKFQFLLVDWIVGKGVVILVDCFDQEYWMPNFPQVFHPDQGGNLHLNLVRNWVFRKFLSDDTGFRNCLRIYSGKKNVSYFTILL